MGNQSNVCRQGLGLGGVVEETLSYGSPGGAKVGTEALTSAGHHCLDLHGWGNP